MNSLEITINSTKFGKQQVLIDAEDFDRIKHINWNLSRSGKGFRVKGWDNSCIPRKNISLCRLIVKVGNDDMVYFHDGNGLNLTKKNIVVRRAQQFIEHQDYYKLIIYDKKQTQHIVYIDKEDYEMVKDFKWRVTKNKHKYYVVLGRAGHQSMHCMIMGTDDNLIIDHKDGNPLNNRRNNLRRATYAQNAYNTKIKPNNTTGYKGVFYVKTRNRYWAYIKAAKKRHSGGFFKTPEEAAKKYNEMAIKYHGEFANLNIITE